MSTKKKFAEHPKAQYWHPTKNGETTPTMVSYGSAKKCWFTCPNKECLHDFIADPNHVTALKNPTWCPYCCQAPKKLCTEDNCKICHERSFVSHPMSSLWYQEKNGDITPRNIFISSNKKFWLKCNEDTCNHLFEVCIANITIGEGGCSYCAHKRLCEDIECEPCMRRSFASHPRSKNWDHIKNGDITPRNIFKTVRDISYWFICDNNHSFRDNLGHITDKKEPRWCGVCLKNDEIKFRSEKYLAEAKEIANERDGELISTVYIDAIKSLDWKCNRCEHQWSACLSSIKSNESWCPNCAGVIPYTLNDLYEHAKSMNGKCLSNTYINRAVSIIWECKEGHIWNAGFGQIKTGTWCPYCANTISKTLEDAKKVAEEKEGECLSTEYINARTPMLWRCKNGHTWEQTYDNVRRVCWCPECDQAKGEIETRELFEKITDKPFPKKKSIFSNKRMELDGYNDEIKIGFEQQGIQHYQYVPFFHRNDIVNFEKQLERDLLKRNECKSLGIYLIEVSYTLKGKEKEDFIRMKLSELALGIKD